MAYERRHQQPATAAHFAHRMAWHVGFALLLVAMSLGAGMAGYIVLEGLAPNRTGNGRPRMVLADTVKGKGVSFMENVRSWHADTITDEQYAALRIELEAAP